MLSRQRQGDPQWSGPVGVAFGLLIIGLGGSCLINPQKDYPVGDAPSPGGKSNAGTKSSLEAGADSDGGIGGAAGVSGEEGGTGSGAEAGAGSPSTKPRRSCVDWQKAGIDEDGRRVVDPDGDGPIAPFAVYCSGMSGDNPLDFLELPHTDATGYPSMNTSTFAKLGDDLCPCPESLTSSFSKVLLRASDLTLLVDDRSFATFLGDPTCHVAEPACEGERIGYGEAEDCRGAGIVTGRAEIDLGDTPFHIAPTARFAAYGYTATGSVDISADRKRASLMGGGFCGGYGPADPNGPRADWPTANELKLEQD